IADPLLTHDRVVLVRPAQKVRRAVDTETNGWILVGVDRDVGDLTQLGRPNLRPVVVEHDVSQRSPARTRRRWTHSTRLPLSARPAGRALWTCHAGLALCR